MVALRRGVDLVGASGVWGQVAVCRHLPQCLDTHFCTHRRSSAKMLIQWKFWGTGGGDPTYLGAGRLTCDSANDGNHRDQGGCVSGRMRSTCTPTNCGSMEQGSNL